MQIRGILVLYHIFLPLCKPQAFRDLAPPGLTVGAVFHSTDPSGWKEPNYQALAMTHFSIMTTSTFLPDIWPWTDQIINTTQFKELVNFVSSKNILTHAGMHYPLYANLASAWWNNQPLSSVQSNMYKYMQALVTAVGDKVSSWDVLNEVMGDDGTDMDIDGVLRSSNGKKIMEYQAMGQNYIRLAFQKARSLAPKAKLILNDYGIEQDFLDYDNEKSDRFYRFVSRLVSEGIPIDGVGFQMHLDSEHGSLDYSAITRNFERFRRLGLIIHITEMDVQSLATKTTSNVSNTSLQFAENFQARVYKRILEVCLAEPACVSFRFWDFADYNSRLKKTYSWLHPITYDPARYGVYTYPTPFADINPSSFRAKPAWEAMRVAMKDYTENEGGIYHVTSNWETPSSYIGCFDSVFLYNLTSETSDWLLMKWRIERVFGTTNRYRIRCIWGQQYLTRLGVGPSYSVPGDRVVALPLNVAWLSQQWVITYYKDSTYKIRSYWGNGTKADFLTRRGNHVGNNIYTPTDQLQLIKDFNYTSQQWYLQRAALE